MSNSGNKGKAVLVDEEPEGKITKLPPDSLERFTDDIISKILHKVPLIRSLVSSKAVSSLWFSVLKDPHFTKSHFLEHSSLCPLILVNEVGDPDLSKQTMHLVEGNTFSELFNPGKVNFTSKIEVFLEPMEGRICPCDNPAKGHSNIVVSSCKGLVCWTLSYDHFPVIVCNPITYEYIMLYDADQESGSSLWLKSAFIGIGFNSKSQRYELLRLSTTIVHDGNRIPRVAWATELFTLGNGPWRYIQDVSEAINHFFYHDINQTVYSDDIIYWTHIDAPFVCSFNFKEAELELLTVPVIDGLDDPITVGLGVLGETMCVSLTSAQDGHVEIWRRTLNSGANAWTKLFHIDTVTTHREYQNYPSRKGCYRPLKYLVNDYILMQKKDHAFFVYDPSENIEICYTSLADLAPSPSAKLRVIPHTPSLIWLKDALQDDNVQVFKGHPRAGEAGSTSLATSSQRSIVGSRN